VNVSSPCKRAFLRNPLDGHRPLSVVRYIVIHDTEGGTAKSIAAYFEHNPSGYTHLVVDDVDCYRCLENTAIPRGAPGANTHGFHIEQCGFAKWSVPIWKKHLNTIKRCAYKTALHCHKFNIPPVWIKADDIKRGLDGVTSHAECSKAFGGDHYDPGPGYPTSLFMFYVRRYYRQIEKGL
jgi:hypothetical protein